jgi:tRNA (guanine37-N1)-methyltransferase
MKFVIITLFPEMFDGVLSSSILKRAQEKGIVEFEFLNLRDFGIGMRKQVDDTPYGGGVGMVLRVDVISEAIESAKLRIQKKKYKVLLMTPQGKRITQAKLQQCANYPGDYIIICGHYEGFDERIRSLTDEEISIGDYILTGGEIPAMVLADGISRLLSGVLGNEDSHEDETHSEKGRVEYPHYTRPVDWRGMTVPDVLISGNHEKIIDWRKHQSLLKTNRLKKIK